MRKPVTISKAQSSFPSYLDFKKLRAAGITHIQELGSDLWTDFNLHDPGVTILEVLCYALTDLGYRTSFDIKDLLTRSPEQKAADQQAGSTLDDDNFFTAAQMLTCNPVTVLDLRKLLIDIPGVRNAWLKIAAEAETAICFDKKERSLVYCPEPLPQTEDAPEKLTLGGLYDVRLEVERDESAASGSQRVEETKAMVDQASAVLHRHRNLCEDIREIVVMDEEQIRLCADIEIKAEANHRDVLLNLYKKVQAFLAPTLRFYSLQEMLKQGKTIEAIFEGRPLSPESHGFIDTDALKKITVRKVLYASDIYREIMEIPEVLAVRKLILANDVFGEAQTQGEKWCLRLTPNLRPVLDLDGSRIIFYKGVLPLPVRDADVAVTERRYREEKAAGTKTWLPPAQRDLPVPQGTYRDLQDYYSIQHDFPLLYGIGPEGLRDSEPRERKAQARQLKAYLLFYDQLLANYLAQLANLRALFSMRPDEDPRRKDENKNRTYFTQRLAARKDGETLVSGIKDLIRHLDDGTGETETTAFSDEEGYLAVPKSYAKYLDFITESEETYYERRHRFLNHLMARFAESFTDYVLLMYKISGEQYGDAAIIQDKTDFLISYPEISRDRGKAFNYKEAEVWDTDNVSGLQKRVAKLLGIDNVKRRHLNHCEVARGLWHFRLKVPRQGEPDLLLESVKGYEEEGDATDAYDDFIPLAREKANYRRLEYEDCQHYGFGILKAAEEGVRGRDLLGEASPLYPRVQDRCDAVEAVHAFLADPTKTAALSPSYGTEKPFFFRFTVPTLNLGPIEITGSRWHDKQIDAENDYGLLLQQARDKNKYKALQKGGFIHYGVRVVDDRGEAVAETVERFTTLAAWDTAIEPILEHVEQEPAPSAETFQAIRYRLRAQDGGVLLTSQKNYPSEADAWEACNAFCEHVQDPGNFRSIRIVDPKTGDLRLGFELVDDCGLVLAVHADDYPPPDAEKKTDARAEIIDAIIRRVNEEGFHLVEHLLLRPREKGASLMPLGTGCQDAEGNACPLGADPYSFRATVVLPYWPQRFLDRNFRKFFERTLRMEAPAHIFLRICWVDVRQMHDFESAYRAWLDSLPGPDPNTENVPASDDHQRLQHLLAILSRLRNVYMPSRLSGCEEAQTAQPVILNQTTLGTATSLNDDTR